MENRSQHIVFLTPGFPQTESDTVTIPALYNYIAFLKKSFPDLTLTVLSLQYPHIKKKYLWNNVDIIPLNGKTSKYKKLWIWSKAIKTLKKIHKEKPITVLHSFWAGECLMIGSKFSREKKIRHINTLMGQDISTKNQYIKHLLKGNVEIVTLSKNHQDGLLKNHGLKSSIIPWSLDIFNFPQIKQTTIDIIGVGSFIEVKNYTLFIEIIAKIRDKIPTINVELIGGGHQKKILIDLINKYNLRPNLKLIEQISRNEILSKMSKSNILLHTSTFESFGYVFSEALYSGMHIVSFEVGAAKEMANWSICRNKDEMIDRCISLQKNPPNKKRRILLHKIDETVHGYQKLYQITN